MLYMARTVLQWLTLTIHPALCYKKNESWKVRLLCLTADTACCSTVAKLTWASCVHTCSILCNSTQILEYNVPQVFVCRHFRKKCTLYLDKLHVITNYLSLPAVFPQQHIIIKVVMTVLVWKRQCRENGWLSCFGTRHRHIQITVMASFFHMTHCRKSAKHKKCSCGSDNLGKLADFLCLRELAQGYPKTINRVFLPSGMSQKMTQKVFLLERQPLENCGELSTFPFLN